jgi:hypothetical protein
MWEKVIGGGVGFVAGRVIGGVGIAAMGGAIGIPALAVTGICTVAGTAIGNAVGNAVGNAKKK